MPKFLWQFLIFTIFLWFFVVKQVETRKVVTNSDPPKKEKPDKSWARSMIDSAKQKYHSAKDKVKDKYHHAKDKVKEKYHAIKDEHPPKHIESPKTTAKPRTTAKPYIPNVPKAPQNMQVNDVYNINHYDTRTTKKSLLQRAKEKAKEGQYVQKAVGFVKKDLGIGVEGPKKPSKIMKYGKKAVEWMFKKKQPKASNPVNSAASHVVYRFQKQVFNIKEQVKLLQNELQDSWNTSEAGTKYKLFQERKSWDEAQGTCEQLGSNLAFLDSESKNEYATALLQHFNVTHAWFGLRTDVETQQNPKDFNNFSNLNGCGVVDQHGVWSISTCTIELPFLCQAIRLNVYVDIPLNEPVEK